MKTIDVNEYLSKYKTDKELNLMEREERLEHYNEMSIKELKLYFSQRLSGGAYSDLCFIYNIKRGR